MGSFTICLNAMTKRAWINDQYGHFISKLMYTFSFQIYLIPKLALKTIKNVQNSTYPYYLYLFSKSHGKHLNPYPANTKSD